MEFNGQEIDPEHWVHLNVIKQASTCSDPTFRTESFVHYYQNTKFDTIAFQLLLCFVVLVS